MDTTNDSRPAAQRITSPLPFGCSLPEQVSASSLAREWLQEYHWNIEFNAVYIPIGEPVTLVAARDGLDPVLVTVSGGEENGAALLIPLAHLRSESKTDFILFAFHQTDGEWILTAEPADQTGLDLDLFAPTN